MDWNTLLLPSATAFGLALLHSLWIGALVYGIVRTALPLLRKPALRHHLAYGGLLTLGLGFAVAFYRNFDASPVCENILVATTSLSDFSMLFSALPAQQSWLERLKAMLPDLAPWLSLGYLLGLAPAVFLLLKDHRRATRLKTLGLSEFPLVWADGITAELLSHPATRRVRCYLSDRAHEVMTLGFWSPVIVFPVALVNRLSPEMARTILLHEIAHLRAYDHLLNYPQQILRTFFFYHPAAHALCRLIDREREHRCDDWVAERCDDRRTYASALVTVARTSLYPQTNLAMSASKTPFSNRIHRLFHGEAERRSQFSFSVLFLALLTAGHLSFTTLGADAGAADCLEEQGKDALAQEFELNPVVVDDAGLEVNMSVETVLEIAEEKATNYRAVYVEKASAASAVPALRRTPKTENPNGYVLPLRLTTTVQSPPCAEEAFPSGLSPALPVKPLRKQSPGAIGREGDIERLYLPVYGTPRVASFKKTTCKTVKRISEPRPLPAVSISQDTTPPPAGAKTSLKIRGGNPTDPIYVIDGKVLAKGTLNNLEPNNIEAINVVKGENARPQYGQDGVNRGVVIITTKNGVTASDFPDHRINGAKLAPGNLTDQYNQYLLGELDNVGYLLDGKKVRYGKIQNLNTGRILSVDVYKGKAEAERLGFPRMEGVISIRTKE